MLISLRSPLLGLYLPQALFLLLPRLISVFDLPFLFHHLWPTVEVAISSGGHEQDDTCWAFEFRWRQKCGRPAWRLTESSGWGVCNAHCWAESSRRRSTVLWPTHRPFSVPRCSTQLVVQAGILHLQQKCLDRRHIFPCKMAKLWQLIRAKQSFILSNDIESILVAKNDFQQYIICPCLVPFVKSHIFRDKLWKMPV